MVHGAEEALPQHGIPVGAASIYYMRVGFPNHHHHSTVLSRGPFPSGHFGDDDLLYHLVRRALRSR